MNNEYIWARLSKILPIFVVVGGDGCFGGGGGVRLENIIQHEGCRCTLGWCCTLLWVGVGPYFGVWDLTLGWCGTLLWDGVAP